MENKKHKIRWRWKIATLKGKSICFTRARRVDKRRRRRDVLRKVLAIFLVLIIAILITLQIELSHAESLKAQMEVLPTSVELINLGEEVQVLVVVKNSTKKIINDVKLSWFTDDNVKVASKGATKIVNNLAPESEFVWILQLSQLAEEPISGNVYLRVDYRFKAEKDTKSVSQVILASLKVKSREPEPVDQIAEVQVNTTLESLNQQRPGKTYLIVTNKSNNLLRAELESLIGPSFVDLVVDKSNKNLVLLPRQTGTIEVYVKAKQRVQPGKHLLLFKLLIKWKNSGQEQSRTIVQTREVNVGILGESEILTLLGVPSFLFLPGFLIISTISFLWNSGFLKLKSDTAQFPLQVNTPEFWLVAITISVFVALGFIGFGRNYLESYGLEDIVSVWLFCVIFPGVGGYIVCMYGRKLYIQWHIPSENDDPIVILKKLDRQKLGICLDRMALEIDGEQKHVFLLESPETSQERETIWVGPYIVITWLKDAEDIQKKVTDQIESKGSIPVLAKLLEEGLNSSVLKVDWRGIGWLQSPQEVQRKDLQRGSKPDYIVEQNYETIN